MFIRPYSLLFVLCLLPFGMRAQTTADGNAAVELLTGGGSLDWTIIGSPAITSGACPSGAIKYTFNRTPAEVVVQECKKGAWAARTLPYTVWSDKGKAGIAYNGVSYEVKELRSGAPACKGNNTCIRLASMPDGTSDATKLIYLTR